MNESNKKGIFSKRNIIIGICILIIIVGLIIFVFFRGPSELKEKKLTCTADFNLGDNLVNINFYTEMYYENEVVNNSQYKYKVEFSPEYVKIVPMEKIEQAYREQFESVVTEKMSLKITREKNTIIISYFIDYVNFDSGDFPKGKLSIEQEDISTTRNINEIKNQISNLDGICY